MHFIWLEEKRRREREARIEKFRRNTVAKKIQKQVRKLLAFRKHMRDILELHHNTNFKGILAI